MSITDVKEGETYWHERYRRGARVLKVIAVKNDAAYWEPHPCTEQRRFTLVEYEYEDDEGPPRMCTIESFMAWARDMTTE